MLLTLQNEKKKKKNKKRKERKYNIDIQLFLVQFFPTRIKPTYSNALIPLLNL